MKKILILLISVAIVGMGYSQDDPGKDLRTAVKNLNNFRLDPTKNADKLDEALQLIEGVVASSEFSSSAKAWNTYGELQVELINKDIQAQVADPELPLTSAAACAKALSGFMKAYDLAEKGYEKKDAMSGVEGILNNVAYVGYYALRGGKAEEANAIYTEILKANDFLEKYEGTSPFPSENEINDQNYYGGVAALQAGEFDRAELIFQKLIDADYDNAAIYEGMYTVLSERGEDDKASEMLEIGRAKYPNDGELVKARINYTLRPGITALDRATLHGLVADLNKANDLQSDNASIPAIAGTIYAEMFRKELAGEATVTAEGFDRSSLTKGENDDCYIMGEDGSKIFVDSRYCDGDGSFDALSNVKMTLAVEQFNKALKIDARFQDAMYGIGELHYQLAAYYANQANALGDDYSKEGTARWEAKKKDMNQQFQLAEPYFQAAYSNDPSDINSLIALREIAVRLDNLDVAAIYKDFMDAASAGQPYQCDNAKSYKSNPDGGCYYLLDSGKAIFVPSKCCGEK